MDAGLSQQEYRDPNMRFAMRHRIATGPISTKFRTYRDNFYGGSPLMMNQFKRDMALYKCIKANRMCSMMCMVLLLILIALIITMAMNGNKMMA
jgi:hypothetical protein